MTKETSPTPHDQQRRNLQRFYGGANTFIIVPRALLAVLPITEALVLSYLLGLAELVKAEERNKGWFYCSRAQIAEQLFMNKRTQARAVKHLEEKELLETDILGLPARRFFYLQYHNIYDLTKGVDLQHKLHKKSTTKPPKKINRNAPPDSGIPLW